MLWYISSALHELERVDLLAVAAQPAVAARTAAASALIRGPRCVTPRQHHLAVAAVLRPPQALPPDPQPKRSQSLRDAMAHFAEALGGVGAVFVKFDVFWEILMFLRNFGVFEKFCKFSCFFAFLFRTCFFIVVLPDFVYLLLFLQDQK